MSYRGVLWHVVDVPGVGVQGELLPARVWGSAPHPPISQSANQPIIGRADLDVDTVNCQVVAFGIGDDGDAVATCGRGG